MRELSATGLPGLTGVSPPRSDDMFTTGETLELGDLQRHWTDLEKAYSRLRRLPESHRMSSALTARRFDEAQPAGTRAYFAAERYLGVAMDNHWALLSLLEHHGVTPSSPWSLLRPSFECAFLAGWVLDPDDGAQRRLRGLRLEVMDHRERLNHIKAFEKVPDVAALLDQAREGREAAEAAYRADAEALGVKWQQVTQKVNVVDELPRLSWVQREEPIVSATMVAQWRMLSGYEHGLGWAMLRGSNATERVTIPGGAQMQLTVNDDAFKVAAQCVVWLLRSAISRLSQLHMTH